MKILYALQGTGNGHIARARDLVPRFAEHATVDVLIAGVNSTLGLGFPVKYNRYGLAMVYNDQGSVSYWKSLFKNRIFQFLKDVVTLPVQDYDLVIIDFEAITSYACKLRGVKALQLSHQAAYWSPKSPRPSIKVLHWEWVLRFMSPAKHALGFHFQPYDKFILPPIIRQEVRQLNPQDKGFYCVYLPSYSGDQLQEFLQRFESERFLIFSSTFPERPVPSNLQFFKPSVSEFLNALENCTGLICGAGFEAPAEALFLGKKLLAIPIEGQYEQVCNGEALKRMGALVLPKLEPSYESEIQSLFDTEAQARVDFPDFADALVLGIVNNVLKEREYDDISSLQVW